MFRFARIPGATLIIALEEGASSDGAALAPRYSLAVFALLPQHEAFGVYAFIP